MTLFDEHPWRPESELSAEQVIYYRDVMDTHVNELETGVCGVCHQASCPDWRDAYDKLAAAGQLMADPSRWRYDNRSKRW